MKKLNLLFATFLFLSSSTFAQDTIRGIVMDYDTKQPVSCASVYIYYLNEKQEDASYFVRTGQDGRFILISNFISDYLIEVYHDDYRIFEAESTDFEDVKSEIEILLYSYDSESYRITDIADQDWFDLGFCVNFYSLPDADPGKVFDRNLSFELYSLNMRFKLANKLQFGIAYNPIKLSWNNFSSDIEAYSELRYFGAFTGLFTYIRFIPTTLVKTGSRGLFLDVGAGYNLPYYFSYSYVSGGARTSYTKIHKLNDFQIFARLGFAWGALKVNYGLTDFIKGSYVQTPKLSFGCEFLIPSSY